MRRRLQFKDAEAEKIKKYLKEKNLTEEQFFTQKIENCIGFNQIEVIIYKQNRWLIEKPLLLWIKLESLFGTEFIKPSNLRSINFELQISLWDALKEEMVDKMLQKYYDWNREVFDNFSRYFSEEDLYFLRDFRRETEIQLRVDGMDNFIDLFLLIRNKKKSKLKRFLNYFVNILQIVKTLRFFEDKFIKSFPNLQKEKVEPKWYEPKYVIEEESERIEYIQKIYLDYGLAQKDTYLLYVEGKTEIILLEDWLEWVYYRTNVKVNIKPIPSGKRTAFMFEYLAKEFNANEHFLILDADKPEYAESKKAQLNGNGITEDSYYIFSPDFVTANFEPDEILEAFNEYFNEISENISEKTGIKHKLSESEIAELEILLKGKHEFDKYEKIVEKFLREKLQNPNLKLKKTSFAQKLLTVMRKNLNLRKREKQYPFETIIGEFITKIQKKMFPDT